MVARLVLIDRPQVEGGGIRLHTLIERVEAERSLQRAARLGASKLAPALNLRAADPNALADARTILIAGIR